jgi:hypothetical protein
MEMPVIHFGQEALQSIFNWCSGKWRWMSSCHVAPRKIITGSGSCCRATLHQLLSTAADYGGHDVVITERVVEAALFLMEMMFCFSARPKVMGEW